MHDRCTCKSFCSWLLVCPHLVKFWSIFGSRILFGALRNPASTTLPLNLPDHRWMTMNHEPCVLLESATEIRLLPWLSPFPMPLAFLTAALLTARGSAFGRSASEARSPNPRNHPKPGPVSQPAIARRWAIVVDCLPLNVQFPLDSCFSKPMVG